MNKYEITPGIDETLSAFLDGETSPKETRALLKRIACEPELLSVLDRHHHLRASLRSELHPGLTGDFAGRVLAGIETDVQRSVAKLVPLRPRQMRPLTRAVFGLAMAASIAAVTVLTIPLLMPVTDASLTIADIRGIPHADEGLQWEALSPDAVEEFNDYLLSHNNSAMDHGFNSTMGFMRVAADERAAYDWAGR